MKKLIIALLLTSNAYAAEIAVQGININDDACKHYSTTTGEFKVTYNEDLPWGSKIELICAYEDTYSTSNWFKEQSYSMEAIAPYTWQTSFRDRTSMRGHYFASKLNFVFRITMPDGSIHYDNGGKSQLGHYSVNIPSISCEKIDKEFLNIFEN